MPAMLAADMEAINRYFMEQATVKTTAAEKVKQEWMQFWKDTKRDWTWYTQDEFDKARNLKLKFDQANTTSSAEKQKVKEAQAKGVTAEEMRGETRRAGTAGSYLEEPEPIIPTKYKVAAVAGVGLITVGMFAKKILANTPVARFLKYLP